MDPRLENIVNGISQKVHTDDVLEKITYTVSLETTLLRILSNRYLDYNSMSELEDLGIPITSYIGEYMNISEKEARSLVDYRYVTSYIVLDALEFVLNFIL